MLYVFHYEHGEVSVAREALKGIQSKVATLFRQQGASRIKHL